ncbi:hypothetical protein T06_8752 [Trichinella sp. T6]|nr:hypothetical protein T06_8752 [Trichinella sp. T6]
MCQVDLYRVVSQLCYDLGFDVFAHLETIPCEQSESRLRESKIQSTKIEVEVRVIAFKTFVTFKFTNSSIIAVTRASFPVSLGKVVIATFGILIYVVRRSERRHSVMVSDYYSMKSTVERGSNVLCITVEQPSSANFAMKLMKILMLKCLLFKRYRSFKKQLKFSGLNSTGNQSDKGLIYCTEFVGEKVTLEARVTSFAGLRRRFNSTVALLQMATATQVASILIHLVWNCTAAILSSLCIFPKGVQYQPAPNGGPSPRSPV